MPPRQEMPWSHWRLDDQLRQAPFPVYGLQGTPFGLIFYGLGGSGPPGETSHLQLSFHDPNAAPNERTVDLDSGYLPQSPDFPLDWRTLPRTKRIFTTDGQAFERFASLEAARASWTTNAPILVEHCLIAEQPFWGSLQLWTRPTLDWCVRLQSEGGPAQLRGEGRGFSKAELFALLEQLVILNQRADLRAHYQAEVERWIRPF